MKKNTTTLTLYLLIFCGPSYADFWAGSSRDLSLSVLGNKVAIACHNCYSPDDSNVNLSQALQQIHQGQAANADLIEIDLVAHNGSWVVSHGTNIGPDYNDVFSDNAFRTGSAIPFIEIKTNFNQQSYADMLVNTINSYEYLNTGGLVVIRSFHTAALDKIAIALENIDAIRASRIRLSRLYHNNAYGSLLDWQNNIAYMSDKYNMVEFNSKTENLASLIEYAKARDLGINLWTIRGYSEIFAAAYRDSVDALTVDSGSGRSREANIELARSVVEDNTNLLYFSMAEQNLIQDDYLHFYDRNNSSYRYRHDSALPGWEWLANIGEDRYGGSLVFDKNDSEYIRFYDRDNNANEGYFIYAVVNFDSFSTSTTQAIVNKSDSGGFALELNGGNLRFGVHVGGTYHYVTHPLSSLNGTNAYQIIGAYDGHGGVRMWIDGNEVGSAPSISGTVTQNNSPIVVGADPQGPYNQRFFFSGKIQTVSVQSWGHH